MSISKLLLYVIFLLIVSYFYTLEVKNPEPILIYYNIGYRLWIHSI